MASGVSTDIRPVTTTRQLSPPKPRWLPLAAIFLGTASLILFGIIFAAIWVYVPERVLQAVRATAPTLAVCATILWHGGRTARRVRDVNEVLAESNGVALDTIFNLTRHAAGRLTGPLRRVK